jgi:hypothetical protein
VAEVAFSVISVGMSSTPTVLALFKLDPSRIKAT